MNTALNYQPEVLVDTARFEPGRLVELPASWHWRKRCSGNHGLIPICDNQGFVFR